MEPGTEPRGCAASEVEAFFRRFAKVLEQIGFLNPQNRRR
jgi:hypothetical protein